MMNALSGLTWSSYIKVYAGIGLLVAAGTMAAGIFALGMHAEMRGFVAPWLITLVLCPFLIVSCLRLYALRLWAGVTLSFVGLLLVDSLSTGIAVASPWVVPRCLAEGAILTLPLLITVKSVEWKPGL